MAIYVKCPQCGEEFNELIHSKCPRCGSIEYTENNEKFGRIVCPNKQCNAKISRLFEKCPICGCYRVIFSSVHEISICGNLPLFFS